MIITLLLYLFVGLNGTLYSLPINKNVSTNKDKQYQKEYIQHFDNS